MEYLQYYEKLGAYTQIIDEVLNLIINGIPSIPIPNRGSIKNWEF